MAYYAVLAAEGFVPVDWLPGFGAYDSPLGHHPDRVLVPGTEISNGVLGALTADRHGYGAGAACAEGTPPKTTSPVKNSAKSRDHTGRTSPCRPWVRPGHPVPLPSPLPDPPRSPHTDVWVVAEAPSAPAPTLDFG
jgi:hypothetical protein